ncbi:amidohydrolase family protein [bacterium]|nr:amidohydrolase family protein [bacterium]
MPEQPEWRFQRILKPIVDLPVEHTVLVGRVLTSKGDEVIEHGFVEIANGKIVAVGAIDELGHREGGVVETGGTILPGLFNNHAHLGWDGIHDLANQSIHDTPEITAYKCASNMLVSLRSGVTTVRDLGMNTSNLFAKQAVEQGVFPGPRLIVCGQAIIQTGGHTFWCCREASGPEEMRRAVREQVRAGADLIKIMGSHDRVEMTDDELAAVIDETHRNGLPITAHATFDEVINRVVRFGVDVVEHGGSMSDETIQLLLDRQVPIVTTFAPLLMQAVPELARQYGLPEWKIAERVKAVERGDRWDGLVRAAKAGVTIAFGTDAGSPVVGHGVIVPEMKHMVKLGVVPDAYGAIRSATSVSAVLNKLDDKLGTLEAGKLADVIVVDGNPLADLGALEKVKMTYVGGKRMV